MHAFPFLLGMLKPLLRDVTSLPSWIYSFLAYIAIQANDQGVRDRRANARLMVSEARMHGGSNWLDYDHVFRQQAVLDHSLTWNTVHSGIQATTLVGRTAGSTLLYDIQITLQGRACTLSYLQPPTGTSNDTGPSLWPPGPSAPLRRRPESLANTCVSWNKWHCTTFRHVCATCIWL